MTTEEAIAEETRRYLAACQLSAYYRGADDMMAQAYLRRAHIHVMARRRLYHYAVTEHESVKHTAGC